MFQLELLPFLDFRELVRLSKLNKDFHKALDPNRYCVLKDKRNYQQALKRVLEAQSPLFAEFALEAHYHVRYLKDIETWARIKDKRATSQVFRKDDLFDRILGDDNQAMMHSDVRAIRSMIETDCGFINFNALVKQPKVRITAQKIVLQAHYHG